MARTEPRIRRQASPGKIRLLKLLGFRYSVGRDAYVLRVIGNRVGPVYRERQPPLSDHREPNGGRPNAA